MSNSFLTLYNSALRRERKDRAISLRKQEVTSVEITLPNKNESYWKETDHETIVLIYIKRQRICIFARIYDSIFLKSENGKNVTLILRGQYSRC